MPSAVHAYLHMTSMCLTLHLHTLHSEFFLYQLPAIHLLMSKFGLIGMLVLVLHFVVAFL